MIPYPINNLSPLLDSHYTSISRLHHLNTSLILVYSKKSSVVRWTSWQWTVITILNRIPRQKLPNHGQILASSESEAGHAKWHLTSLFRKNWLTCLAAWHYRIMPHSLLLEKRNAHRVISFSSLNPPHLHQDHCSQEEKITKGTSLPSLPQSTF